MVSGGGQTSSGSGSTGNITSLSFVPSLLANAFFGTGIGIDDGGFLTTGIQDFTGAGKARGGVSSLVDPYGLGAVVSSNPYLGPNNPFSSYGDPGGTYSGLGNAGGYYPGTGQFGGSTGGGFWTPQGFVSGAGGYAPGYPTSDFLSSLSNPQGSSGGLFGGGRTASYLGGAAAFGPMGALGAGIGDLLGIFDQGTSPEDEALARTRSLMKFSPQALGLGQGGTLNPNDLISNIMDLIDPAINPGIGAGLQGLQFGQLGQLLGNNLLFGDVTNTLSEGLQTGFKPDLQPVINEATRAFFGEIVPQLGQNNVALQEGVGPFSTDLSGQLLNAGGTLASQLGALEVQNQNLAADRRGEFLGLSTLITDALMNAPTNAARNTVDFGEQLALQGTRGGRQATILQLLAGLTPQGPVQASSSQSSSSGGQGGISK